MLPHMPVYDPTSIGGYRGVNRVLDGGDPTNPVEDAALKNPGNRKTAKILGTAFLEINFTKWLKFRSTFGVDYANALDYRFSPIFNDNGTIAGSSATRLLLLITALFLLYCYILSNFHLIKLLATIISMLLLFMSNKAKKFNMKFASGNQPSNDLRTLNNATNVSFKHRFGENTINVFPRSCEL